MKKTIAVTLLAAGVSFAATFTGVITDSACAKGDHKAMNMGSDDKCTVACVKHGAKYVLYDGKTAYELSDQKAPEQFAGKKVMVHGTLDAKAGAIKVDSLMAAK